MRATLPVLEPQQLVIEQAGVADKSVNLNYLEAFFRGYVECSLWSSYTGRDEEGNEVDNGGVQFDREYEAEDIDETHYKVMVFECLDFIVSNYKQLEEYEEYMEPDRSRLGLRKGELAGHDFWLTRNGHGTGFWDRGVGMVGDALSKASKTYGSSDLYLGDDGKVYVYP